MKDLNNIFEDKKIAIVGPSSEIENHGDAKFIDSYDVVVRINDARTDKKYRGMKTDVVYIDGNERISTVNNHSESYFVVSHPNSVWFAYRNQGTISHLNKNKCRYAVIDEKFYSDLSGVLNDPPMEKKVRPNTGCLALFHLLSFNIKELFIVGIDFYNTGYEKEHMWGSKSVDTIKNYMLEGDGNDFHHPERQLEKFIDLYELHKSKILLYPPLKKAVEERLR
jgi:hypothetical protein|tara:strand:+ start:3132 stop:3800 length:669 start_codon:yes stop_codon:yes gene_type:complete